MKLLKWSPAATSFAASERASSILSSMILKELVLPDLDAAASRNFLYVL
jgi:hypothetical protein